MFTNLNLNELLTSIFNFMSNLINDSRHIHGVLTVRPYVKLAMGKSKVKPNF